MQMEKSKIVDNLFCGDCAEVMKEFPDSIVDLVVTSPPYDDIRDYENGHVVDVSRISKSLFRIVKDGGVVVWVVGDGTVNGGETGTSFRQALAFMETGWLLHDTMIYQKHNPTPNTGNGNRYQQCFEYMFVFAKGKPKTVHLITEPRRNECGDRRTFRMIRRQRNKSGEFEEAHPYYIKDMVPRQNIWNYKVGSHNTTEDFEAYKHPAIFPDALARDHIMSWSNEGDVILDPFCGSGTTLKMAKMEHRHYIGIDISEKYLDIARTRIAKCDDYLF